MITDYVHSSLLEPNAVRQDGRLTPDQVLALSAAISLKRIADTLTADGVASLLRTPVNNYGESFTDAIQMGIVRGQRGVDVI